MTYEEARTYDFGSWMGEAYAGEQIPNFKEFIEFCKANFVHPYIELKKDANPNVVLNQLYKHTQLQDTYGVIMLALVNNQPMILNLKQMLELYLKHQEEVVTRRTRFESGRTCTYFTGLINCS